MIIGRIQGWTRECGKSQGYLGLPLRDYPVETAGGRLVNSMTTAWMPTPEEIAAIVAGAPVCVMILGETPPPMHVFAGVPPDAE